MRSQILLAFSLKTLTYATIPIRITRITVLDDGYYWNHDRLKVALIFTEQTFGGRSSPQEVLNQLIAWDTDICPVASKPTC